MVAPTSSLVGQWFGPLRGGSTGSALLYMEQFRSAVQGRMVIVEGEPRYGYSMSVVVHPDAAKTTAVAKLDYFLNLTSRRLEPIQSHAEEAARLQLPPQADVEFALSHDARSLDAQWRTSLGNTGTAHLKSFAAPTWSQKEPNHISWEEFRHAVGKLDRDAWIFRGQAAQWSLRTCFHRRGRYDLIRYANEDVSEMLRVFVSATNQWLDVANPFQHASLLATAQHNGYPTPLLDWTRSPYVAAYFAVREATPKDAKGGPRIHALDARRWRESPKYQTRELAEVVPTLVILESVPFWNPRAVQQQSVTTMTNVDDIEGFLDSASQSPPLLEWFDFDPNERELILDDLEWMGVTESLLFPGMEGSFRTLARRRFPE